MKNTWKDIEGYEGLYQVSDTGEVRNNKGKILSQTITSKGYCITTLSKNGKRHKYKTHRLVAKAFLPNYSNLPQVNHIDENKFNNDVSNLEWCDNKYNSNYYVERHIRNCEVMI